jgi:two-component system sensor histidine kinase KdpD
VAVIDGTLQIENASPIYLLAVTAVAIRWGTLEAIATAVGAVLIYNFAFVEPRFTLFVGHVEELVTLALLLFVGAVIGRLTGLQRDRERVAARRETEARALFAITRELATAQAAGDALPSVVARLATETGMARVWVAVGANATRERVLADTAPGTPLPAVSTHAVLRREADEDRASWIRIRPPEAASRTDAEPATHRIEIAGPEGVLGSIWARRPSATAPLSIEETRLLAAAADLVGQALTREHLVGAAAELEISRRSDDLKSALLDSVTHDLRTPLASIRAAAGSLADETISLGADARRAAAASIDREAQRLNRLVGNLLDMSRIRAGVLVPHRELVPVEELTDPPVERASTRLGGRHLAVEIEPDLPPLWVDPVLLDEALANLLDNAIRHTTPSASIRLVVVQAPTRDAVLITVEDDGPGVPADQLPRLFERFAPGSGHRSGFGLGLAVARGMVEAMGGTISAAVSELGGLAVTIALPLAAPEDP